MSDFIPENEPLLDGKSGKNIGGMSHFCVVMPIVL